ASRTTTEARQKAASGHGTAASTPTSTQNPSAPSRVHDGVDTRNRSGHAEDVGDRFQLPEEQVGEPLERRLPQVVPVLAELPDHVFTAPAEPGETEQAV